jgi:hypothetical protein
MIDSPHDIHKHGLRHILGDHKAGILCLGPGEEVIVKLRGNSNSNSNSCEKRGWGSALVGLFVSRRLFAICKTKYMYIPCGAQNIYSRSQYPTLSGLLLRRAWRSFFRSRI